MGDHLEWGVAGLFSLSNGEWTTFEPPTGTIWAVKKEERGRRDKDYSLSAIQINRLLNPRTEISDLSLNSWYLQKFKTSIMGVQHVQEFAIFTNRQIKTLPKYPSIAVYIILHEYMDIIPMAESVTYLGFDWPVPEEVPIGLTWTIPRFKDSTGNSTTHSYASTTTTSCISGPFNFLVL